MREPSQAEEAKPQSQDWFEIVTLKLSDQQQIKYDFGDNAKKKEKSKKKQTFNRRKYHLINCLEIGNLVIHA